MAGNDDNTPFLNQQNECAVDCFFEESYFLSSDS